MLCGGTQPRALPRYRNEEMKILNLSILGIPFAAYQTFLKNLVKFMWIPILSSTRRRNKNTNVNIWNKNTLSSFAPCSRVKSRFTHKSAFGQTSSQDTSLATCHPNPRHCVVCGRNQTPCFVLTIVENLN